MVLDFEAWIALQRSPKTKLRIDASACSGDGSVRNRQPFRARWVYFDRICSGSTWPSIAHFGAISTRFGPNWTGFVWLRRNQQAEQAVFCASGGGTTLCER